MRSWVALGQLFNPAEPSWTRLFLIFSSSNILKALSWSLDLFSYVTK